MTSAISPDSTLSATARIYTFSPTAIDGTERSLAEFQGRIMLLVNTASHCGFTPQYAGLEALYQQYKDRGLVVLGFPCNQFGAQEPGTAAEISQFCQLNYGITFPMFARIDVNGPGAHPLYRYLTSTKAGLFGTEAIKWNFTKFLVDREGLVVGRFAPRATPAELAIEVEKLLAPIGSGIA